MATPVLEELRKQWPSAEITAMCQGAVGQILREDPNVDEIFAFSKPSGWLRSPEGREIVHQLRLGKYDLGVLLPNSFSSAWWFWRGRIPVRVGYEGHIRKWILNPAVPCPADLHGTHLVEIYKDLLKPLGIDPGDSQPKLYLSAAEKVETRDRLRSMAIDEGDTVIGINVGAAYGSAKCWLPDRFTEVARGLLEDPRVHILFFGDAAGASLVQEISRDLPSRAVNLATKTTLRELMGLIDACDAFLSNDSGPMHMAYALETPLLALFGPTSAVRTGPYKFGEYIHKHVDCSPCYKRTCPIDHRCMKRIESNEVLNRLRELVHKAEQT